MIDLHTHSSASDGSWSPAKLIHMAKDAGIGAIALTDHDCIDGIQEAEQAAARCGIRLIRGVEIEIVFSPGEFHLLGLDLAPETDLEHFFDTKLFETMKQLAQARETRNRQVLKKFADDGYPVSYDEIKEKYGTRMIGRPHIAEHLVDKGIVKNKQKAFDEFLAKGKPYFIQKNCIDLQLAINLIHDAGGLAFTAHPMSLYVSWPHLKSLLIEWKEMGLDGIEAWHPLARVTDCERLERLARGLGLRISAGSDYHGPIRPDRKLGLTAGDRPIDDMYLSAIKR
ncbi:MAG TPA: PHP domain-containing protein [Spirochaetales bacterium]|nr:PHP domain-containing protein [Spirochaetales bacterium]